LRQFGENGLKHLCALVPDRLKWFILTFGTQESRSGGKKIERQDRNKKRKKDRKKKRKKGRKGQHRGKQAGE